MIKKWFSLKSINSNNLLGAPNEPITSFLKPKNYFSRTHRVENVSCRVSCYPIYKMDEICIIQKHMICVDILIKVLALCWNQNFSSGLSWSSGVARHTVRKGSSDARLHYIVPQFILFKKQFGACVISMSTDTLMDFVDNWFWLTTRDLFFVYWHSHHR